MLFKFSSLIYLCSDSVRGPVDSGGSITQPRPVWLLLCVCLMLHRIPIVRAYCLRKFRIFHFPSLCSLVKTSLQLLPQGLGNRLGWSNPRIINISTLTTEGNYSSLWRHLAKESKWVCGLPNFAVLRCLFSEHSCWIPVHLPSKYFFIWVLLCKKP